MPRSNASCDASSRGGNRTPTCSPSSCSAAVRAATPHRSPTSMSLWCWTLPPRWGYPQVRRDSSTWRPATSICRSSSSCRCTCAAGFCERAGWHLSGTRTSSTSSPSGPLVPLRASVTITAAISTRSRVVDRDRILAKLDALDSYLRELRSIVPANFEQYLAIEKRRACERLLQVSIEAVIDVCALLVTGLRLGLPADEDDLFEKLSVRAVISSPLADLLRRMKGMRNILVHEYGRVDDELIFETVQRGLDDFDAFRREIVGFLRSS